jgi:hypothetical protein
MHRDVIFRAYALLFISRVSRVRISSRTLATLSVIPINTTTLLANIHRESARLNSSILKMEAARFSITSLNIYQTAQRHNAENCNVQLKTFVLKITNDNNVLNHLSG